MVNSARHRADARWGSTGWGGDVVSGYAVVDVETTGLRPSWHDRIVEIAVVQVAPDGGVEATWSTLVNPMRDLGPQVIHGISAADVLHAPTFEQIAGTLASLLAGRVFVAHNASFDLGFVQWSFGELGHDVPLVWPTCVCTTRWADRLLPGASRTLAGCCEIAGVALGTAHEALSDATATAGLLRHYLHAAGMPRPGQEPQRQSFFRARVTRWQEPWAEAIELASSARWPYVPAHEVECVRRGVAAERDVPFLARLVDHLPRTASSWEQDQYLSLIDRALLDRYLSSREHDALAAKAEELGIDRPAALALHREYLDDLARAALADEIVTGEELDDLRRVAALLSLPLSEVESALLGAAIAPALEASPETAGAASGKFRLAPGDMVAFTGDMDLPREEWMARAAEAGLVPHTGVTKRVALVIAADPDSLSGKARKAADYGVPIVTEQAFARMLEDLIPRSARL